MPWVFALVLLVLIVALALVVAGRLPTVPQPTPEPQRAALPAHPGPADVDLLRLPVALRGYRMEEVDAALAVLRDRIAELEAATVRPKGPTDAWPQDPATDR
jgi:DivIVA domain-containing protein